MKPNQPVGSFEKPLRVGVFETVDQAEAAVSRLLKAGFSKEQITVISSDQKKEAHFEEYGHQKPGGSYTPLAAATGSVIGAVLGGLSAVAGVVTTGGIGILATGGIFASTGAIVGGFIGAMTSAGIDKELAAYYDQAVEKGRILVAVEDRSERAEARLAEAERMLSETGAQPIEVSEG
jgi:hypothetical protein